MRVFHLLLLSFSLTACQATPVTPVDAVWQVTPTPEASGEQATLKLKVSFPQHTFVGQADYEQLFVILELDGSERMSRAFAWQAANKALEVKIPVTANQKRIVRIRQIVSEDYLFALSAQELRRLPTVTVTAQTTAETAISLERNQPI